MNVELFIPCFIDQLYPQTAFNTLKLLEKAGCKVDYNSQQTCCGQPAFNAGFWDEAKTVGSKFLNDFSEDKYIVSPSASCTGMVKIIITISLPILRSTINAAPFKATFMSFLIF